MYEIGEKKQNRLSEKANKFIKRHKMCWERWPHGEPVEEWTNENGDVCIKYEDGTQCLYGDAGEWW